MRLKDIRELAETIDVIPGIHNYCDRWCERCAFTARCMVYAMEQADPSKDPTGQDIDSDGFAQTLSSIFEETKELMSELAEESGIYLTEISLAERETMRDKRRDDALSHPLAVSAQEYVASVRQWFDFQRLEVFSDKDSEAGSETDHNADLYQHVEVIRWYQFFIAVKIIRGLTSRIDEEEESEPDQGRDSDGSVKAALIAIDRSLNAWQAVRDLRPEDSDSITGLTTKLEDLRLRVETEFPRARDFIRPGFDEEPSLQ